MGFRSHFPGRENLVDCCISIQHQAMVLRGPAPK